MQCSISGYYRVHLGESTKLAQCRKKVQAAEPRFCSEISDGWLRHPLDLLASVSGFTTKACHCTRVFCYRIAHPLVADLAWISRPTCSPSELQIGPWHRWKNGEAGIQSCSSGKNGELSTASSTSLCHPQWSGRAPGKCVLSPLLWRVEGTSESQTLHGFPTRKLCCV